MRSLQVHEPIRVVHSEYEQFPQAFTWRARQHRVWKIEQLTEKGFDNFDGLTRRRIFKVQTHTGLRCSISYDERRDRWSMESVYP
jgi:hypothetical protein